MLVGYMRVSTAEQNLALQRDALLAAGIAPGRIYEDTCSGTVTNRPGLARALEGTTQHSRREPQSRHPHRLSDAQERQLG